MSLEPFLTAARLRLRPLSPATADAFAEALAVSVDAVSHWLGASAAPRTPEALADYVAFWERARAEGTGFGFVAEETTGGRCAGFGFVNQLNRVHRFANLGYWVRSDAAGQGYATVMTRLLAGFAFRELGLQRVELVVEPENLASQRVAEKVGAEREGLLRKRLCINGQARDAWMFALVAPVD